MARYFLSIPKKILLKKVGGTLVFFMLITSLIYVTQSDNDPHSELNEIGLLYYGSPSNFTLPNINGGNYSFGDDQGVIRVVNFMYSKCPGNDGCALTTLLLSRVNQKLDQDGVKNNFRFISIDFDYINDTMDELRTYAEQYTTDTYQWQFLLGNKNQTDSILDDWGIYAQPNNHTSLALNHGDNDNLDPYNHSIIVYIVDGSGFIRKFLLGTGWFVDDAYMALIKLLDENND